MAVRRRLVAVVVADVVGYSRLMESDETGTHQRLRALRAELFQPSIAEHGGRTVKTTGDGLLLEFASATAALRCAVEIQREMASRNRDVAPDERIEWRIGINLGDIIVDGDDIIGDGVNVAARLEALADAGGICVAAAVWEQVREDLGVDFVDSGEQRVKNISKPVRVFRVVLDKTASGKRRTPDAVANVVTPANERRILAVGAALVLVAVAAGFTIWRWSTSGQDAGVVASVPLRSVIVMPFIAAQGDPSLASSAAHLTVDVTRALGDSMRSVRVVPPATAQLYAAKNVKSPVVGREAAVRFMIESDLRPVGDQIAITQRLTDAADGRQVDSDRYVVERARVESDEVVQRLTSAARVMLSQAIARSVAVGGKSAASAEDFVDRANNVSLTDPVATGHEVRRLADEAIKRDPQIARAWALRSDAAYILYLNDFASDAATLRDEADVDSLRAVTLDARDVEGWHARSNALRIRGNMEAALAASITAEGLDPTRLGVLVDRVDYYLDIAKPAEALKLIARLRSMSGFEPGLEFRSCAAHVLLAAYDEAVAECERTQTAASFWNLYANLTAAYAMRGDDTKAQLAKRKLMEAAPMFTIARYEGRFYPSFPPQLIAMDKATYVAGLRKAGVSE